MEIGSKPRNPKMILFCANAIWYAFSSRSNFNIHINNCRSREKEKEFDQKQLPHHQYQQHLSYQKHSNNKYSLDLEHDHALPTSAPNADILKSNSNPTYPNPNRHHNHGHRAHMNSTPSPAAGRSSCLLFFCLSHFCHQFLLIIEKKCEQTHNNKQKTERKKNLYINRETSFFLY